MFVTQQPKRNRAGWTPNLEPATKFGSINFIFSAEERIFEQPRLFVKKAIKVLEDFEPSRDYILWPNSGDPIAVFATIAALVVLGVTEDIRVLYWERKQLSPGHSSRTEGFYIPITVPLDLPIDEWMLDETEEVSEERSNA